MRAHSYQADDQPSRAARPIHEADAAVDAALHPCVGAHAARADAITLGLPCWSPADSVAVWPLARVFVLSTAPPCLLARSARGVSLSCRRRITSLHRTFNAIGIRAATNAFQANANFIATWLKIMVFGGMPNEDGSRPASALVLVVGRFASTRFAPPHPRRMILL